LIRITHLPFSELVLHEIIEQQDEVFFEDVVRQSLTQTQVEPTVNWVGGFAFLVVPFPSTEDVVRDNLVGKIHFLSVIFTKMEYRPQVPVKLGSQVYSVRLRKADNNRILVAMVSFLRDFKPPTDN
jgi:hypothetical protein